MGTGDTSTSSVHRWGLVRGKLLLISRFLFSLPQVGDLFLL
ncbi:hypothetical protein [Nostoc sp. CMAA1605]|nr:hypothetical protein [Nostoc sp. CMAA1605]